LPLQVVDGALERVVHRVAAGVFEVHEQLSVPRSRPEFSPVGGEGPAIVANGDIVCVQGQAGEDDVEFPLRAAGDRRRTGDPLTNFPIWQLGGAVARVGEDETAFNGRGVGHTFNISAATETAEGFDEEREWVRNLWSALEPHHTSVYVNFLMDEGEERIRQAYGTQKYDRLKALKRRYDPDNFFRLNQNIPPS
jgi:hypothetical protein